MKNLFHSELPISRVPNIEMLLFNNCFYKSIYKCVIYYFTKLSLLDFIFIRMICFYNILPLFFYHQRGELEFKLSRKIKLPLARASRNPRAIASTYQPNQ